MATLSSLARGQGVTPALTEATFVPHSRCCWRERVASPTTSIHTLVGWGAGFRALQLLQPSLYMGFSASCVLPKQPVVYLTADLAFGLGQEAPGPRPC